MDRIRSVDLFRVVAIFGVIVIHTRPFFDTDQSSSINDVGLILNQLARFAVPFFFVVSGYFWTAKIDRHGDVVRTSFAMCRRVVLIFIFWTLIYVIERTFRKIGGNLSEFTLTFGQEFSRLRASPITTVFEGSKSHLWFLPALISCVVAGAIFVLLGWQRALLAFAVMLFVIGLCGAAYKGSPLGFSKNFNFRNGPFFGLIFFVLGRMLFYAGPRSSWLKLGFGLFAFGTILQFTELALLHSYWGAPLEQDFVFGTVFTGLGVSMIALSNDTRLRWDAASKVGLLVLGIYALHHIFVDIFAARHQWSPWLALNELMFVLLVFALSVSTAYVLSKGRITRQFVA